VTEKGGRRETLVVEPEAAGERLDLFVARRLANVSRKAVKRALDGGRVFLEGRCERRAGRLLAAGETVTLTLDLPTPPSRVTELPILFRDADLLAVAKPSGLPPHPLGNGRANALEALTAGLRAEGREQPPILLHRLDADTTGVLLLALSPRANRSLFRQFADREVQKRYRALVAGEPPDAFRVENRLRSGVRGRTVVVATGGQPALTEFRTLGQGEGFALVDAIPHTGRTHQIRVHLAEAGFPLLGDTLYGGPATFLLGRERVAVPRHLLHAAHLRFCHPATGAPCAIEAPVPADFHPFLARLAPTLSNI
jgi:RluA family pseudouridine synthase